MAAAPRTRPDATDINGRLESLEQKVEEIRQLPMTTLKWVGGLVVGAAITVLVQNFALHEQSTQNTQAAVQTAVQATAIATKRQVQQGTQP